MRKVLLIGSLMFGLFIVWIVLNLSDPTNEDLIISWNEEWGLNLPVPDEVVTIWATEKAVRGDGEWIYALRYLNGLSVGQKQELQEVTDVNVSEVQQFYEKFRQDTIEINEWDMVQAQRVREVFDELNVEVEIDDYFFRAAKNVGNDSFLAIYKKAEKTMYVFEWNQ